MCTTVVAVVVVTTAAKRIPVRTKPPSLQLSQARALVSNTPCPWALHLRTQGPGVGGV